jgi:tRNA modification GTPase
MDTSEPLTDEDREIISLTGDREAVIVLNKTDLTRQLDGNEVHSLVKDRPVVEISAAKGTGLSLLKSVIRDLAIHEAPDSSEAVFVTRVRHKVALGNANESLQYARESARKGMPPELISVDLRGTLKSLGEIVGETASEDILHQIFSRFCIGK